jgi:hypothetical protein
MFSYLDVGTWLLVLELGSWCWLLAYFLEEGKNQMK